MSDRIQRFLHACGIENIEDFDLDFLAITKDLFEDNKLLMVFEKQTPWEFGTLEQFGRGVAHLPYPVDITIQYRTSVTLADERTLFDAWFMATFQRPFPGKIIQSLDAITLEAPTQEDVDTLVLKIKPFKELMLFITYPNRVVVRLNPRAPIIDAEKVDKLNRQAKEIAEIRLAEEDNEAFIDEHVELIKKEEARLADAFEHDVKQQAFKDKERRKKQTGDYDIVSLDAIQYTHDKVEVQGTIYSFFKRQNNGKLFAKFVLGHASTGLFVTLQEDKNIDKDAFIGLKNGVHVRIRGGMTLDMQTKEPRLHAHEIVIVPSPSLPEDHAP